MRDVEKLLKALANSRRLHIIKFLARRKRASVGDIADEIKLSFKSTSRHLSVLANVSIVRKKQEGLIVWHELVSPRHSIVTQVLAMV